MCVLYVLTLTGMRDALHTQGHRSVHRTAGPPTPLLKISWSAHTPLIAWTAPAPSSLLLFFFSFEHYLYKTQHIYNVHKAHM